MVFEIILIVSAILGGVVIAWSIENILPAVIDYLKKKIYQRAIVIKGEKINELMNDTNDPEIRAELEAKKRAMEALMLPMDNSGNIHYEDVAVLKPQDPTGEDRMSDAVEINVDGTYRNM